VLLWCLDPGASSGFGGTRLSSFCVKGLFFFVASPVMVVAAVCFRPWILFPFKPDICWRPMLVQRSRCIAVEVPDAESCGFIKV
jgi:hypothetical protein